MHNSSLDSYAVADIVKSQIEFLRKTAGENQTIYIAFNNGSVSMQYKSISTPNEELIVFHGVIGSNLASLVQNVSQLNFIVHIETELGYEQLKNINF